MEMLKKKILVVGGLLVFSPVLSTASTYLGSRSDAGNIKFYLDQTVTNQPNYWSAINTGVNGWTGISSKIKFTKVTAITSATNVFYVGTTTVAGAAGRMIPYTKNSAGALVVDNTGNASWNLTTVTLYSNTLNSYNATVKAATATHEIGHALKLAHVGSGTQTNRPLPSGQLSIMSVGLKNYTAPQPYDKTDLINKWGI